MKALSPLLIVALALLVGKLSGCPHDNLKRGTRDFGLADTCRSGHGEACVLLGKLYAQGWLIRSDPRRARRFWSFACHQGRSRACARLQDGRIRSLAQRSVLDDH